MTKSVTAQAREAAHDAYFRHADNASTLAAGKAADAAVRVVLEHLAADLPVPTRPTDWHPQRLRRWAGCGMGGRCRPDL